MTVAFAARIDSRRLSIAASRLRSRRAQPLATDDAAVVAPKTCQLEAWSRMAQDGRDYWAQPACQLHRQPRAHGRRRPRPARRGRGVDAHPAPGQDRPDSARRWRMVVRGDGRGGARHRCAARLVRLPALLREGARVVVSARGPGDRPQPRRSQSVLDREPSRSPASLSNTRSFPNLQLLAETFHGEPGGGKYQVGARYIVIPDRFEAYTSYGNRFSGPSGEWWAIVGIRLQTLTSLPVRTRGKACRGRRDKMLHRISPSNHAGREPRHRPNGRRVASIVRRADDGSGRFICYIN